MRQLLTSCGLIALTTFGPLSADEGMWTLDNLPLEQLKERYDFQPDRAWLDHVQRASVRFNSGGSASFVSKEGLIMTNHHVALGTLHKLSTPETDYVQTGFLARTQDAELICPGLEVIMLDSFENVTETVHRAIITHDKPSAAVAARKAVIARLTKESEDSTGLQSEMVSLYQGGEYWIYRYKKFTDVRLVMAPEAAAGFFGGDSDNFTYPRYALDFAFFRAYEDGKPVQPSHAFRWSENGATENELVFVSGHPGRTERQKTVAQLKLERDLILPTTVDSLLQRIAAVKEYQERSPEARRQAHRLVFGLENAVKSRIGALGGLEDPEIFQLKGEAENSLRKSVREHEGEPALREQAWLDIAETCDLVKERWVRDMMVLDSRGLGYNLMGWAQQIVRYSTEIGKPNEERFEEFADANLARFKNQLLAAQPSYPELEEYLLGLQFGKMRKVLGDDDPLLTDILALGELEVIAARASADSSLGDPAVRKRLMDGGKAAVEASDDPMIQLARIIESHYRPVRKWYDENISIVRTRAGAEIAKSRFTLLGRTTYPDATYSLRLSFGKPASYTVGTARVPHQTVFGGLYARSDSFGNQPPFDLSPSAANARDGINMSTPMNLVTTNDITGGNSGSPLINQNLEIVGLIFDGNLQSLSNQYVYSEKAGRAVSVHSSGIIEALRHIYKADELVAELLK